MAIVEVQMSSKRYPEEFKIEAVRQVVERGHCVTEERDIIKKVAVYFANQSA